MKNHVKIRESYVKMTCKNKLFMGEIHIRINELCGGENHLKMKTFVLHVKNI